MGAKLVEACYGLTASEQLGTRAQTSLIKTRVASLLENDEFIFGPFEAASTSIHFQLSVLIIRRICICHLLTLPS